MIAALVWLLAIGLGIAGIGRFLDGEFLTGTALIAAGTLLWLLVVV